MTENIRKLAAYLNIEESQLPKDRRTEQVIRRLLMWILTDIRNGILYLVEPNSMYEKIIKKANKILEDYPLDEQKWSEIAADAKLLAEATLQLVGADFSNWTKLSHLPKDSTDGWVIELKRMGVAAMHAASTWIVLEIARGDIVKAVDAACWAAFNAAWVMPKKGAFGEAFPDTLIYPQQRTRLFGAGPPGSLRITEV